MSESKVADEIQSIRRIGTSADGFMLRRYLQRVINSVSPVGSEVGALREYEGRRRFALELRALLDEDAASAGLGSDRTGKPDPDEPFRVTRGKPVAVTRGGTGRRVEPYPGSDGKSS